MHQGKKQRYRWSDLQILPWIVFHQEYPNKIAHVMSGDEDLGPPRELTPVFFGCFDWHSSVHGHWLLTRLLRPEPRS